MLSKSKLALFMVLICSATCNAIAASSDRGELVFKTADGETVRSYALPDPYLISLSVGTIDLRRHALKASDRISATPIPVIVAFQGPARDAWRKNLEAAGAQVVGPLPPSAFLVRADGKTVQALGSIKGVVAMAKLAPSWKMSPRITPGPLATAVEIVVFDNASADSVIAKATALGEVLSIAQTQNRQVVTASLSPSAITAVAALPEVEMVDAVGVGSLFNDQMRVVMQTEKAHFQANQAFYNPIYGIGVWGANQTVTVADSGLAPHEVFAGPGKVLFNYAVPNTCVTGTGDASNHGTGVAATLLGDKIGATSYGTANDLDGLSLRSDLIMQDIDDTILGFCPPNDYIADLFFPAWSVGSMVHSNSWGHWAIPNNPQGSYSWRSQMIDEYMHHPVVREQVILFAAGNAGAHWTTGAYIPFSLSDEAHAKNAIVVGGSGNGNARDFMYQFSSRGPTDDCLGTPCAGIQRVKPDVLAPASFFVDTADTSGFTDYSVFNGTSIAAPAVAGAASLVRDYFLQGLYPVKPSDPPLGGAPSSALIKAMLINATVPIYDASGYLGNAAQGLPADAYPNYDQGYGRPVLDNVLEPAGYRKLKAYEDASTQVATGDVWQRRVRFKEQWGAGASCNNLRVTLAWNDEKATLAAGPKLVNDLDLEVTFQGTVYRGNHRLTGGTVFDATNNVEDVFLPMGPNPLGSALKPLIRVYGTSIPAGPQPFAVVATYGACADTIPCPPRPPVGGCYRGPGDVVPGSTYTLPPACGDQTYSTGEFDGSEKPFPFCKLPITPIDAEPVERFPGEL